MSDAPPSRLPLLAVLPSRIHGHGLYAVEPLAADEMLMRLGGEEVKITEETPLSAIHEEWNALAPDRLLVRKEASLYRFINHSPTPNTVLSPDGHAVHTLRAIAADEEITLDYSAQPLPPSYRENPQKAFLWERHLPSDRRWVSITLLHSIRIEPHIARVLLKSLLTEKLPVKPLAERFPEGNAPLVHVDGSVPESMIVRALREARNFATYVLDGTEFSEAVVRTPQICRETGLVLRQRRQMAVMGDEAQFLYITELDFVDEGDEADFASRAARLLALACARRDPIANLDLATWYGEGKRKAHAAIMSLLRSCCPGELPRAENVTFPFDTAYPMMIVHGPGPHRYDWLFAAEESASQVAHVKTVDESADGAFAHLGWCYGIAAGVRQPATARGLLAVVAYLQMEYHLRWLINRVLQLEMSESAKVRNADELERRSVAFDELLRDYERSRVKSAAFFGSLRPRIHEAALRLKNCWHQDDSFAALDQAFRTQRGFLERRYDLESERAASRQQKALNLIVVVQTFSVLSIALDGSNLSEQHPGLFALILFISFMLAVWLWQKTKSGGD